MLDAITIADTYPQSRNAGNQRSIIDEFPTCGMWFLKKPCWLSVGSVPWWQPTKHGNQTLCPIRLFKRHQCRQIKRRANEETPLSIGFPGHVNLRQDSNITWDVEQQRRTKSRTGITGGHPTHPTLIFLSEHCFSSSFCNQFSLADTLYRHKTHISVLPQRAIT